MPNAKILVVDDDSELRDVSEMWSDRVIIVIGVVARR
jgi:hypothetical protein